MSGATIPTFESPSAMSGEGNADQHSYPTKAVETSRKDSGFDESQGEHLNVYDPIAYRKGFVDEQPMTPDLTSTPEQKLLTESRRQDTMRRDRPTAFSSRSSSRDCQSSISTASRGTSKHTQPLSRKSTSSHRNPRLSLIHSASSFYRPPSVYNKARPAMSRRTSSAPSTHGPVRDVLTFHHNSCLLFQTPSVIVPQHQHSSATSSTERLTDRHFPPPSHHGSLPTRQSIVPTSNGPNSLPPDPTSTEPRAPHSHRLDLTRNPPARIRENDKCHRGIRGWWQRIAPRWLLYPRSSRTGFYNGHSDTGSVRTWPKRRTTSTTLFPSAKIQKRLCRP